MTRTELEKAVARTLGESRKTVQRFGFSLLVEEPAPDPHVVIDCPGCGTCLDLTDRSEPLPEFVACSQCDAVFPYAVDELYVADGAKGALAVCA